MIPGFRNKHAHIKIGKTLKCKQRYPKEVDFKVISMVSFGLPVFSKFLQCIGMTFIMKIHVCIF